MLTSHRTDGLIEWMKKMLSHSFVLDSLKETACGTFEHFEELIEEHILITSTSKQTAPLSSSGSTTPTPTPTPPVFRPPKSRLQQIVPTVGTFHTPLPLRRAFEHYDDKYKVTQRKFVMMSFNEIRQILNLSQVMAMCTATETADADINAPCAKTFSGPKLITFDGDQTLYSDGANFSSSESSIRLSRAITALLQNGATVAIVTAAGYEYASEKYEHRISGLLDYFRKINLSSEECR